MEDASLYNITPESMARELERLRNKADHDWAQALYHAEQEGLQRGIQKGIQIAEQRAIYRQNVEIAKKLLEMGLPLTQIAKATGLTLTDIKELGPQL